MCGHFPPKHFTSVNSTIAFKDSLASSPADDHESTSSLYPATDHCINTVRNLVESLTEVDRAEPQIVMLSGGVVSYRNDTDREFLFRQESNFFYLTGCDSPGSHLVIVYQKGTSLETNPRITLFISEIDEATLMWSVPPHDMATAIKSHQVNEIKYSSQFEDHMRELLASFTHFAPLIHTLPPNALFPELKLTPALLASIQPTPDKDATAGVAALTDAYLLPALHRTRLIKDGPEIELIRRANKISSDAHEVVMRVLGAAVRDQERRQQTKERRPLLPGEWMIEREEEAEAIFVASCRREGSEHQAYLPIVAGGNRSSVLHYVCNCESLGPNKDHLRVDEKKGLLPQVLLIDAGCEWACYASDITRTMPVGNGGKFTPEAREIYKLVWEMQKQAFDLIRPGVHWDEVHLLCHRILICGLQKLGIFKSPDSQGGGSAHSEEAILASGASTAFFPHGLGHSLGMDVHDVPSASKPEKNLTIKNSVGPDFIYKFLRLRIPLEVGMVVTVEPGCYFHEHLISRVLDSPHINLQVLNKYRGMGGVRIEDVVHIVDTPEGYVNLTTVRSDIEWVEGVCSGAL